MKIECANCNKSYEIPDERLPFGKEITFPCPNCKEKINLDLRSKSANDGSGDPSQLEESGDNGTKGDDLKQKILKSVHDLPPMPQTVHKVREILSNPGSSFKELAEVLETDQAIAAKVLKISNSSYYGMAGKVSSIKHASVVLGHKTLGELITMVSTSGLLANNMDGYQLEAGALWRHSMAVAFGSRLIASKKRPALADDAFSAGLIHDAGKLILDPYVYEKIEAFEAFMNSGDKSFLEAEQHILGLDHSEIAAEVCRSWQIPEVLTKAIRYHHEPMSADGDHLTHIVHIADALAMMTGLGTGVDGMLYQMEEKSLVSVGIGEADVGEIMAEMAEYVEKAGGDM